jgi:hypothetical protein
MSDHRDVVDELRAIRVWLPDKGKLVMTSEAVEDICSRGAREIVRLRRGLIEIAGMGDDPFNRQSRRARELLVGDER